jgi:ubiquitin C-terminal hydrolase
MRFQGIPNVGATCWFNSLIQCFRACPPDTWKNLKIKDSFTKEFVNCVQLENPTQMSREQLDPRPLLSEFVKKFPSWQGLPNDAQEALLHILDILNLDEFKGEMTQTITYPGGKSVTKVPMTVYIGDDYLTLSDYVDSNNVKYNVAIQETKMTTIPKILIVSTLKETVVKEELFGKKLFALIPLCGGHYVAFVKDGDGTWYLTNDESVSNATPNLNNRFYLCFYT